MKCCDMCGKEIKGEYVLAVPDTTETIYGKQTVMCEDICMDCWKAFKQMRRIPLAEFPNSEVKNEKS